jgi:very-short-patch-repair endonuclease
MNYDVTTEDVFEHLKKRIGFEERWEVSKGTKDRWQLIRDIYDYMLPRIMKAAEQGGTVNPYIVDWDMTPIERLAWMDIRGTGLPLYPQFPVGRVFLDFADPYRKIGVELDGAAFHEHDRDLARDNKLVEQGWKIFRIKGRVATKIIPNPFEYSQHPRNSGDFFEEFQQWAVNDSTGFFWALKEFFYRENPRHKSWAYDVLSRFQLADFDLEDYE